MTYAFPQLLLPHVLASRNRARRRERGDLTRAVMFGIVGLIVCGALFQGSFWLTSRLDACDELGDYLLRIGLSWLFLTFLSFLAFSAVVTALSTFFLSEDLRLLLTAPVAIRRLFHARFFRTVGQSSWMVVIFLAPVLMGIGRARCAGLSFYLTSVLTTVPFAIIPVAAGTLATLFLVNTFPARRARDLLMLMGLLFAASLVILLRFIRPEQLLKVESLPDLTDFFSTLQSPITPLLPSFWAGESLFASLQGVSTCCTSAPCGRRRSRPSSSRAHGMRAMVFRRFQPRAGSAQSAVHPVTGPRHPDRRAAAHGDSSSAAHQGCEDVSARRQPMVATAAARRARPPVSAQLPRPRSRSHSVHDRVRQERARSSTSGWPGSSWRRWRYGSCFPPCPQEGAAFWIIRTSPVSMRDFLWSKFWTGLLPVLMLTEVLTIAANQFLGVDPFLKTMAATAIFFMSFALVGLAVGLGARYPRFNADVTQVAGSYGGVAFMIQAVLFVIVMILLLGWPSSMYLFQRVRRAPLGIAQQWLMGACFASSRGAQHNHLADVDAVGHPRARTHARLGKVEV